MRRTLWSILGLIAAPLFGQEPGLGPYFTVNSYTTYGQFNPSIARNGPGGNFVIAWTSVGPEGGGQAPPGIVGRRFDVDGNPLGGEFAVNTYSYLEQVDPRVASDSAGNFVVVWSGRQANDDSGIGARLFSADGTPEGPQFTVHGSTPTIAENLPAVARSDAGYVVVWQYADAIASYELQGMRFNTALVPQGGPFAINTYTTGGQVHAEVAMDASGSFFVSWTSGGGVEGEIRGRAFDANGQPLGNDFQVNTYTTGVQYEHSVSADGTGGFVVCWTDNTIEYPIRAQRIDATGNPSGPEKIIGQGHLPRILHREHGGFNVFYYRVGANLFSRRYDDALNAQGPDFQINDVNTGGTPVSLPAAADIGRQIAFTWGTTLGSFDINARRGGYPDWAPFKIDARASGGASNQNGVLEAGERVMVDPAYLNLSGTPYPLAGTASNFSGPANFTYTIHDNTADYGTIAASLGGAPAATTNDCFTATGNCFEFELGGTPLAGTHQDTTYDEALSEGVSVTRTIHVGGTFFDVSQTSPFYPFIETLLHNGITGGCSGGNYCPTDGVKRQQMAAFLLKSKYGKDYVPAVQCTGTVFADVPITNPFACYIEDLYAQGVTGGCAQNPLQYCPDNIVNRQQMAVFLLKMKESSAYDPPDCTGIFTDVSCTPGSGFSDWIEELYNRQITGGCVANPLQYCPQNSVTRQQMAAFLSKNFGLVLYGP